MPTSLEQSRGTDLDRPKGRFAASRREEPLVRTEDTSIARIRREVQRLLKESVELRERLAGSKGISGRDELNDARFDAKGRPEGP